MKMAPHRCVGPVQMGVDAVTAATKIGGSKIPSKNKTATNDKKPTEPETSEGQAQFVMWQKGTDRAKPALFVDVVPRVGLGYASLLVPNKSAADEMINPPPEIADMGSRLRIGDVVRVTFSKPNGKLQVHALDIVKPADQDAGAKLFTYGGVRSVKVDGQDRAGVTFRRKTLSWTFLVPAGGAAIVPVASTAGPRPAPLNPEWSESLARFRVGDQVFVDYDVADYQFILKDVSACQMAVHGTFVRTGKDTQGAKGCPTVVVQCGAREILLLLSEQGTALSGAPAGDASAYPSLKDVKPGQEVDVKYHKEAGLLWLDEIVAAKK
jgi:hypothetical protein